MALSEDQVSRIIQAFARAVLDPSQWLPALQIANSSIGTSACSLDFIDLNIGEASIKTTFSLERDAQKLYEQRIIHISPRIKLGQAAAVGEIITDVGIYGRGDPNEAEFLDWVSQTPARYIQGAKILEDDGKQVFFSSQFACLPDNYHEQFHEFLIPYLINFIEVGRSLSRNRLRNSLINLEALEHERPFALIDRAGRLIECSAGFEAIMMARRILGTRDRTLVAIQAQHRPAVQQFLASALVAERLLAPPLPIRLVGPNCRRGIVLRAIPIAPGNDIFDIFRPAALIAVTDLDHPQKIRRGELVALFGLTAREADVAALVCEGFTTERVSQELGISEYTVRQHLKAVFGKVGVARQSELVSLISRLS